MKENQKEKISDILKKRSWGISFEARIGETRASMGWAQNGVPCTLFYSMNREETITDILTALGPTLGNKGCISG